MTESLPLWERGLKCVNFNVILCILRSLPLWERGLKFKLAYTEQVNFWVAPLVGAWIEILLTERTVKYHISRSPCGSVD